MLNKEECIATYTILEQAPIKGKDCKLLSSILDKLDKKIVTYLKKEEKESKGD